MAAVFLKLLNLSISASWLVLAVLVLRLVSKRSPKWMNVLLWGIVALRLVLPFSVESALSLIPSAETVSPAAVQFDPAPTITSGVSVIDNAVNPSLSEHFSAVPTASVNPLYVWTEIAGWVWLIGLGAMLLYALVSYLRLRRRVSVSLPIQDHIYLCDAISSPFILGVVKPHIYLPSGLDEVQRQNVLSHERAHLARRDHWWKPLGFALLAVYWFNPVLWLAYALLCRDIELACDERVIRTMDESAVKTYSTVLLACSMLRKAAITCPLAFGEVGVKERVKNALHYKKPAFWVVAASVAVCVVVAVCFLTNPPTDTDAAGLIGFHRERVTYADVTDENGAQPSNVQLTAEETDAVYALLDTLQYKRLGTASAMQDCYARLYFISAAGERCEVMLSEREMLVNPITGGKTARLYELRSGSTELRDYLLGCIGTSDAAEEEMKTLTDPKLGRRLTVPVKWDELAVLAVGGKGIMPPDGDPNAEDYIPLFRLYEKRAYESAPQDEQGYVWNLCAMRTDRFERTYGADAVFSEILGIADYVIGSDDEYVYLLTLPSDVRWLENDPVSYRQYKALQSDSQGVLTRFLKDNGIHINEVCPASSVFSPPARGDAASTTGYAAYDALLAEISDLRRSGASEAQTDFSHDLLSVNDYYQTPGWLLRDLDGDGIPELLLGADWGDGHSVIFNIYRLDGAKAVRVVDGWSRSRWYLCTDGSLAHEGSDGASEGTYSYYRYENGALRHLETVISLDGWLYSDTTDHYVGGKGFRPVSEDEANAVREKYTHETLSFTPFVV
jgi:antirepressor regulating drug resistance, predicted signal transduction N-terminal membrane component